MTAVIATIRSAQRWGQHPAHVPTRRLVRFHSVLVHTLRRFTDHDLDTARKYAHERYQLACQAPEGSTSRAFWWHVRHLIKEAQKLPRLRVTR